MKTLTAPQKESPASPNRIPLKGHKPLSQTTLQGWPSILFGIPFAGFGAFFISIANGWTSVSKSSIHAPLWVIGVVGGIFFATGVWLAIHGGWGLRRIWNMNNGKRRFPTSPWLWDYPWNARGISDTTFQEMVRGGFVLLIFIIFLAPFNWIAFFSNQSSFFWKALVGSFDVIILLGVGGFITTKLRQYLTYGNSFVAFQTFPYYLGSTLSLTLKNVPHPFTHLHLYVRGIEEAYEIRRRGGKQSRSRRESVVVCYQLYKDSKTFNRAQVQPSGDLHVSWTLPPDNNLTSTPSERPAKYWELEVTAEGTNAPYQSFFLLPIYSRHV